MSARLGAFVLACFDCLEEVELLGLLRESDTAWSARAVAARLGVDEQVARRHLESLSARGLIRSSQAGGVAFRYGAATDALRRSCDELTDRARRQPMAVVGLVKARVRPVVRRLG